MLKRALVGLALALGCNERTGTVGTAAASPKPPPAEAAAAPADDQIVARWEGGQITYGDLRAKIDPELRNMDIQHQISRYEVQAQALDNLVVEALLEAEAKRLGHPSVDALLVKEIEDKVTPPTQQEIADFYPIVARQFGGASLEEVAPFLEQELIRRKQQDAFGAYLEQLRSRAKVSAELPYPDLPRVEVSVAKDDPIRGKESAPVTIVQFAEYQCYYCNKVSPTLDRLMAEYDGKVRLVFKDFPLSGHSRAMPAAVAAHCAGEQKKYWEMNSKLLGNQQALEDGDLARYAAELGLDAEKFQSCLSSGQYEPTIQQDMEAARQAGVSATPAFFVNGVFLSGAQPYERFQAVIDRELAR